MERTIKMDFNYYVMAEFNSGVRLCKAPFASMVKVGDLVEANGVYGKGKVVAVESASTNNNLLNLLIKINYPKEEAYEVSAIYSKKVIGWSKEND